MRLRLLMQRLSLLHLRLLHLLHLLHLLRMLRPMLELLLLLLLLLLEQKLMLLELMLMLKLLLKHLLRAQVLDEVLWRGDHRQRPGGRRYDRRGNGVRHEEGWAGSCPGGTRVGVLIDGGGGGKGCDGRDGCWIG